MLRLLHYRNHSIPPHKQSSLRCRQHQKIHSKSTGSDFVLTQVCSEHIFGGEHLSVVRELPGQILAPQGVYSIMR